MSQNKILQPLIDKYWNALLPAVIRVTYGGKYVIVKGKTIAGALYFIQLGYTWFRSDKPGTNNWYEHFYNHIKRNPGKRFSVRVILKTSDIAELLKKEQDELDKCRWDSDCLNNNVEAYIPKYNEETQMFGWIEKGVILGFRKHLKSKIRKDRVRAYNKMRQPKPAMSV